MRNISQRALGGIEIGLPPFAEQRRIVETLEDHLSRLDAGSQTVAANLRRLKLLRTRLIADVTSQPHPSMMPTTVGSIARRVRNGIFVSRPSSDPIGVPILRIGAVRPMSLDLTDLRYTGLSANSDEISSSLLESGDLLFTRYNGNPEYVGACAVVPDGIGLLTYPDKLIRVAVDLARANPRYVALVCSAGNSRHFIRQSVKTTAGQAGISGRELKAVPLELPDLAEQQRRIDQFDEADRALIHLDTSLGFSFQRAAHLRRALLAEAFSGRLAPQDPAEKPASELLARIEAERASLATGKAKPVRRARTTATTARAPKETTTVPVGVQEELPL